MQSDDQHFWKKCSICKKEIGFGAVYYLCSVSTCKHVRTGYRFCSVPCWDGHLGSANHRESWAEEVRAPSKAEFQSESSVASHSTQTTREPVRKIVGASPFSASASFQADAKSITTDTLIVVSKVKKLISDQSGMSTSQCCIDALTRRVVEECLKGIANARTSGRKTVMGRDIK